MNTGFHVAIVGATGAVGAELIQLLEHRDFPVRDVTLLASQKSDGMLLKFKGTDTKVQALTDRSFDGVDLALFSAGAATSREFGPAAVRAGATVVDNSSAFRMDAQVPLVVPEINADDLRQHRGIIANPNCTTIVSVMALFPLHQRFRVTRVIASSYQAVSGAGARAVHELSAQVKSHLAGQSLVPEVFAHPIAFNVFPQVDLFLDGGYTKEELKFVNESRKIMHHPQLRASITCVRVPVFRCHSVAINAEFEETVSVNAAREVLSHFPGIDVIDDPSTNYYPTPLNVMGKDNCQVGRLRIDTALDNGLAFWVCGDQLLKGAALNAVQIAETLIEQNLC